MGIIEFYGGRITHKYLMNKTKYDLARMYLELLELYEAAQEYEARVTELEERAEKLEIIWSSLHPEGGDQ